MWNIFNEDPSKQIHFQAPFSEKYRLVIDSHIVMGSMEFKTQTQCRWDVRLLAVGKEQYDFELLTLENGMLQTNNPSLSDIASLNNAFGKMYSELRFTLDRKGQLLQVNNLDQIASKWQQTKAQMLELQNTHSTIEGIIDLNDEVFARPQAITQAVGGLEFFELYFHNFFGRSLPDTVNAEKKSLFGQNRMRWQYAIQTDPYLPTRAEVLRVSFSGTPLSFCKAWNQKAYGVFPLLPTDTLQPKASETGQYQLDTATGKVLEATLEKQEIAHSQLLHSRMHYHLISDSWQEIQSRPKPAAKPQAAYSGPSLRLSAYGDGTKDRNREGLLYVQPRADASSNAKHTKHSKKEEWGTLPNA
jgi:hypothetical protein